MQWEDVDQADEDWNDADAWLRGIQDVARQQEQQDYRDEDIIHEDHWEAYDDRGPRSPAHREPSRGYGPIRQYGGDDGRSRAYPYYQDQYRHDDYSGLSLAQAIRSPWSASNSYDHRDWRRALPAYQTQNNWGAAPMRPSDNSGLPQQHMWGTSPKNTYAYPSIFNGKFTQAMSFIARNPSSGVSGRVCDHNLDDSFKTEVSQALAIKLNLKTKQHANKKVLHKLVQSGGKCTSLKQALQARAAVYGEVADPS